MKFYKETSFKETPIGRIPRDWEVKKATLVANYINGYQFGPKDWDKKGLPIIRIQNLNDPNAEYNYFSGKIDDIYKVNTGDIIFSWSASLGVYLWKGEEAVLNQHIFKVIPKSNINKLFLYYALTLAVKQLKRRAHGSTMKHFRRKELDMTLILLPPLTEQQKIAEILLTVDEAVHKINEIIAKTERLKKGLMQELLTKGIGHKEFKDTEIGRIPKEWEIVKLKDVSFDFIGGGTPSTSNPEYWDGDIAWMTSAHINGRFITSGQRYITKKGLENSATNIIPKDNLLVATRVGIGKAAINKIDIAISQDLTGVIVDKDKALPDFLYWVIISNEKRLKSMAQGSTIKGILREDLGHLLIPKPPLDEQKEIAEILSAVDAKHELEKKEKTKLEKIKQGLMDLLLTGKIRIKVY